MHQEMPRPDTLSEGLLHLLNVAKEKPVDLKMVILTLAKKGYAVLLILFSLPFCQPIQIPGFSTPFGLVLAFIGLRIAFGHHIWIPEAILNKNVPYEVLDKISAFAIKISEKLRFLTRPRLTWIVRNSSLQILHGLAIMLLGMLLALPLPIPFSNILFAYPLLFFGLGFLEDDGVMVIVAYTVMCIGISLIAYLTFIGGEWLIGW